MKAFLIILLTTIVSWNAHAEIEDKSFYGAGIRLGLGYTFVNYEQHISDTNTDFTTEATSISFLHLIYGYEWNPALWFLAYGSLGTVTYSDTPGSPSQTHTSLTGDVNLEARYTPGGNPQKESWVPTYIIGINGTYMPILRAPETASANYEYGLVPIASPVLGLTTTQWGDRSAWRNTLTMGVPMFSGSGMKVKSGYRFAAVTSYTFALGEHMDLGVEGLMSYLKVTLTEHSQAIGMDVEHQITDFSVGPRIFFSVNW